MLSWPDKRAWLGCGNSAHIRQAVCSQHQQQAPPPPGDGPEGSSDPLLPQGSRSSKLFRLCASPCLSLCQAMSGRKKRPGTCRAETQSSPHHCSRPFQPPLYPSAGTLCKLFPEHTPGHIPENSPPSCEPWPLPLDVWFLLPPSWVGTGRGGDMEPRCPSRACGGA